MNVNGARFDLLLGRADWGRCLGGGDGRALRLASWWDHPAPVPSPAPPAWDERRSEVTLRPLDIELPRTPGEAALVPEGRRGAAADRNGNVYRIGPDRRALLVTSSGTRRETAFWPDGPAACADLPGRARLDFQPVEREPDPPAEEYLALATTADDYLVVAFAGAEERGLLAFDLVAGGPPVRTLWPREVAFEPFDMAAREGGGVWVLDRIHRRLWELDRCLEVVGAAQPEHTLAEAELDDFQPLAGTPRERPPLAFPGGIELAAGRGWALDPVAVESPGRGVVLLLDRAAAPLFGRVVRLRRDGGEWRAEASPWLEELLDPAHDFVFAAAPVFGREERPRRLFVTTSRGNQARAYRLAAAAEPFALKGATELFPLRLYGGRALLSIGGAASYDSGLDTLAWTRIVHQPRTRFAPVAVLTTPVFDSRELGTTWDRLLLDGCVPPDTSVEIESCSGDERSDAAGEPQVVGVWLPEPRPHLRPNGAELPWVHAEAVPPTRRESGVGTWEVLLQRARGRYLQLRIRLGSASGIATPRLRALRVWSPRFSYPERFLPAVYREEEASASLLERWLANFESTLTGIEGRIAEAQLLFDPRTAPAEALAWLAGWLDVAFDPAWDERRRRLMLAHAMEFFRWRGTVHGLSLALELAFGSCFDPAAFRAPGALGARPRGIRIVERYQTRLVGALAAGDPGADPGPRTASPGKPWTPGEGNARLADRFAGAPESGATPVQRSTPVPLVPPAGDPEGEEVRRWRERARAALGFVPAAGAEERTRWQTFLATRYPTGAELRAAHGASFPGFGEVPLPRDWPDVPARAADWREFSALADGAWTRRRWQDFLARRYRRIERLNREHGTAWPGFEVVALPDVLPNTAAAQADWLRFERQLLAMHRTAHRFSVLLPVADVAGEPFELEARLGLARRVIEMEKPAHTVFDVRFYWAFFRVGEARLELDTQLGAGSRAPELIPPAVLGRTYIGASFVGGPGPLRDPDRLRLTC